MRPLTFWVFTRWLSIYLECRFLFLECWFKHSDNVSHTHKNTLSPSSPPSVPSGPQTSVPNSTKLLLLRSPAKLRTGLTFNSVVRLCLRRASHGGEAKAQSGIQTWQRCGRWVMQRDDRAQIATALFPCEDSVCQTAICAKTSATTLKLKTCARFWWIYKVRAYMVLSAAQLRAEYV